MTNISTAKIGASFEKYAYKCLSVKGWNVERIENGYKQIGENKFIRMKQPFDYFATKTGGKAIYFDAKTTAGESYPYSAINRDQLSSLLKIQRNGFVAGFVVHFRQVDKICFIDAETLNQIVPRASIRASACVDLGKSVDVNILFGEGNV